MKFRVQMKNPDALADAIDAAVKTDVSQIAGLDEDERAAVAEQRVETFRDVAGAWFEYDEYLTVEIDTEAKTCVVVPL